METRIPKRQVILNAKAATGVGTSILVNDYKNILLEMYTASSADLTVKIQGAFSSYTTAPDFSASASATNPWIYLASYDLSTGTLTAGATGYVFTGTDGVKGILVNTDGIVWLNMSVTARAAGNVSVNAFCYNNH